MHIENLGDYVQDHMEELLAKYCEYIKWMVLAGETGPLDFNQWVTRYLMADDRPADKAGEED